METRKLAEITPYDRNPRKNDGAVDRVLESLNRHGQVKPIVLSAKGKPFAQETVVAGHTTLRALERFGAKEAFVVVKEFADEAQFVDYNLRDNKTSEFAEWDEQELANLSAEFDISLDEMGFDMPQIEDEDFSDKNEEIDMDNLDDTCELKIKMDADVYEQVLDGMREINDDPLKALLKALNIES
jgi:hypothetical protein